MKKKGVKSDGVHVVDERYRARDKAEDARLLTYLSKEFMLDPRRLLAIREQVRCGTCSDYKPWNRLPVRRLAWAKDKSESTETPTPVS